MGQELEKTDAHFRLKKEITLGDMLTPISVLLSVVALWFTWSHDADLKRKQYADQIRHSASVVTAKIERWSPLADRYFEDIQSTIVDVSEKVEATHTREPANRILFKGLVQAQATASQRIVDEQLEVAYIELYGYVPSLQKTFDTTIQDIKSAEAKAHEGTSSALQGKLQDDKVLKLPTSILIGNELRSSADEQRKQLWKQIEFVATPLREKMLNLINLSDEDIMDESKREAAMQGKLNASAATDKKN
jgi:nitrogen fixation-related uncharacterized protein